MEIKEFMMESGSFRDRKARVLYHNNQVFRCLTKQAIIDFRALIETEFFKEAILKNQIIGTFEVDFETVPSDLTDKNFTALLIHNRIPFISYSYEWTFSMLKDAAILHLELLLQALNDNFIIKDSSSFNIQWIGASPTFIDITSLERYREGDVWAGYLQFCQMFLYPLMLGAYKGLPFQSILRGDIEGVSVEQINSLMSACDLFRPGILRHVYLQSKLQNRFNVNSHNLRQELKDLGFHRELILTNVKSLLKLVTSFEQKKRKSIWRDYAICNSYQSSDMQLKVEFVSSTIKKKKNDLIWDFGANTGTFSKIAAESGAYVLAMDSDRDVVEFLYHELKASKINNILPLVINLANPSSSLGWRGLERKALCDRGKPDLILALALIHHAVFSSNIPLAELISWFASFASDLIIEFVSKEDEMVKTLLANKEDNYDDYEIACFESYLRKHYKIYSKQELNSGTRTLYFCRPL